MESMKMLKLELDDLAVESFDAGDGQPEQRGTVQAHASYLIPECPNQETILPPGACSTRCTSTANDSYVDCTWSCDTAIDCSNGTCP
jgi:hypothetical protein